MYILLPGIIIIIIIIIASVQIYCLWGSLRLAPIAVCVWNGKFIYHCIII